MRLALAIAAALVAAPASAQLSDAQLRAGFDQLDQGVDAARAALFQGDEVQRDVLAWVILRNGMDAQATLADHLRLIESHPDWPVDNKMQSSAEASITQDTPDIEVLAYFIDRTPRSAAGLRAYLRALIGVDAPDRMREELAEVWPQIRLDDAELAGLIADFPEQLAPHHWARADALAWAGRVTEARAIAPHLPMDQRGELAARIAYLTDDGKAGVLDAGRGDIPALAYARFQWLLRKGDTDRATAELRARRSAEALGEPSRWVRGRLSLVRRAMRDNQPMIARDIASQGHLDVSDGASRATLEWLAGYIAYDAVNAPQGAIEHWQKMLDGVRSPVSKSRGWYWIAQAHDRMGDDRSALAAQVEAARHQTAFYGQLAAESAGLQFDTALTKGALADVPLGRETDLLRGLDVLVLGGQRGLAYSFVKRLGQVGTPDDLRTAAVRLLAREEYFLALRLGKAAAKRGLMLPEVYFPLHPLAELDGVADPALALAIARQESEFRADAGSPAGALGLMQLMPATAERTAKSLDLPYKRSALIHDWQFNARLGAAHLEELRERFGDSPVLIAAGYNAGGGRVRDWIAANGDPRDPKTDPVKWIEAIPFEETRNYVMRVLEAIRPYEARLTGQAPTRNLTEMLRGKYPLIRPRARPDRNALVADTAQQEPTLARPRARP